MSVIGYNSLERSLKGLDAVQILAKTSTMGLTDAQQWQLIQLFATDSANYSTVESLTVLSASETTATGTTLGLTTAFKGLWATLMANPILLVIGAVVAGATAWSKYKQYIEETRQATEEAANTYKESASSIDDYVSKYQELRKALIEAKGDEEETYNVKKQLLDLQTELNEKFGDEYGKLNLVIDAYKDQAKAIKAYNKEAAQTYLNENQKGIETAAEKMTDINHYNLSYTGISSVSDEGKALKEIAEKYADQGVKILDELGDGSQFSIHLKADPQSAYDTINAFESDVRDKAKELGDEHLFDDVLDMSSNSLNDAKSIIDEWGEIYQQSLLANIATDDTLSEGYNKAIAAVEAYNEAVLQIKDPYSDEHVAKARQNLQSVYEELSGEEWEKYGSVVQDVFDQADTSVYDFNQTLKNDDDLKTLAEDLEGLSNLDLQSLNPGENASFDKLKASADESGISVENLIDALVRLGYVQGEIASAAPQLDSKWDYSATIKNLDTAKEKLNVLGQTYAKLFDEDSSIGFEDLSSIAEAFGDIEELDITSFIQQLQEAGQNGGQVKSVIGNLISKYLSLSGILGNVTAENQQLITSFLEEEGVVNANEIVTANLAAQELYLKLNLDDATSSIHDQVTDLMEQEVTTGTAYSALYDLIVEQNIFSTNSTLDVSGKIKALEELALAYGITADAAHSSQAYIDAARFAGTYGGKEAAESVEQAALDDASTYYQNKIKEKFGSINAEYDNRPKQKGGNSASKVSEAAEKETDIMSELNSEMDEYQSKLKAIKEARETYNEHGKISIDQAQEILDADFKLLAAYGDEEAALEDLGRAKLNEMQIQLARNAIDTINSITTEAEATQYLAGANANLAGTSLAATEAMLQQAVAAAKLRGEMQGTAAETILQGYQNGAMMLGQVDFSFDSTEVEKTALEKFQDWFSTLFDWIEKKLERQADKIDKYVKRAENHLDAGKYTTSSDYYRKAIHATVTQIGYQDEASKKYKRQANEVLSKAVSEGVISQDEANSIAYNVKNGSMDISEYSDEMKEVISSYEEWNDKAEEAAEAIEDLHEQIREYIKDLKDVRDAQRDARIDTLDLYTTIGTGTSANSLRARNDQLYYKTSQLGNQNKAYNTATRNADTDVISFGNTGKSAVNSVLNTPEAKKDREYRAALNNAKKAIKSKNPVSGADLKIIKKYSITTYNNLFAYNRSLENLETARLEQATNYAATSAEIQQNRDEKTENRRTELNDNISLLTQKSDNASSAAEANNYLNKAAAKYDAIIKVDDRAIASRTATVSDTSKTISSKKGTTAKFKTLKSDDHKIVMVNKYIREAKEAVKKGIAIGASTISGLAKYYSEGYISRTFYESCIDYNNALESLEQAKLQKEIDVETAKAEKAAIGTQKFSNVEQEYTNKQTAVSDKTSMIQAKQNSKTARGLSLTASDYNALLTQSKAEQKIYEDEIIELQKTINENLSSGYWTKSSQGYLDAISSVNAYQVKVQECTTAQEEYNNTLAQLPYDTIEAALDLLDAVADYNKSVSDLKAASGKDLSEDDYLQQIQDNNDQIKKYQEERLQAYQDYQKALANADQVYGGKTADQWLAEYNQFGTTINNLEASNESLKDSLRDDVYWRDFERAHQAAKRLLDVVQGLSDLISDDMLYDSDGRLTEYGVAQAASLVKQYELVREEVQNYADDIRNLNALYTDAQYEEEEYKEKLNELQTAMLDSASSMKSYSDSIIDMYKNMAQAELDSLFALIDARNDALQKKKEYYDYDKSIRSQTKDLQALQAQRAALEGLENSAETKAKKAQLDARIREAQDSLDDTLTEHQFELSQDALADMKEILQDTFDDKWDNIAGNLSEIAELMNAANELTVSSASTINETLNQLLQYYGIDPVSTGIDAAYASGIKSVPKNMIALTNEDGNEIIVTKDGILTPLNRADDVIPAELTERLYDMAMGNYSMPQMAIPMLKLSDIDTSKIGTTIQQNFDSLIHIDGNADALTVEAMEKYGKKWMKESYDYMAKKAYNEYLKAGGIHRI